MIKPYKETVCKICNDGIVKKTISGLCFTEKPFHYQKSQQDRYLLRQKEKALKTAKNKPKSKTGDSIAALIEKLQILVNRLVRQRDNKNGFFRCISCKKPYPAKVMQAGHYLPAGNNGAVRFHLDNIHGQCHYCNIDLHGNQANYRSGLIEKIGLQRVEDLERLAKQPFKWDRQILNELIQKFKGY